MPCEFSFHIFGSEFLLFLELSSLLGWLFFFLCLFLEGLLLGLLLCFLIVMRSFYALDASREAEVTDLDGAILVEQNVRRLEVPVEDFCGMEVLEPDADIVYNSLDM